MNLIPSVSMAKTEARMRKPDSWKISILAVIPAIFLSAWRVAAADQVDDRPGQAAAAIEQGRAAIKEWISDQGIPGLSVAVAKNGDLIWSEGFGSADVENNVPASPKTRYRIGSVSKVLTAAALARLAERNLLDLDAPVQRYVPSFPAKEHEITPRLMAGHLAGLRHYRREDYINTVRKENVLDSLKIFQDDPLLHRPGEKYFYSSYGYVLLSAVIEGVTKKDFLTSLADLVFAPAEMTATQADDNRAVIQDRSRHYSKGADSPLQNEAYTDPSDRWAAGGFLSTAEDLARFGSLHLKPGFFEPETLSLLFTSQKTLDGNETGVGLGWRIGWDAKGRKIYHHGGDSLGGRAFLVIYPESGFVIAIAANLSFARIAESEAARLIDPFL